MSPAPPPDASSAGEEHAFLRAPHRTLVGLSVPVLFSLVAEPLTGLVDTAFVARLGVDPLAALGVGTIVLSSIFWIFNFLGIGTQTEVAQAFGRQTPQRATQINGLALALSGSFGVLMIVLGWFGAAPAATAMGATGAMHTQAVTYMQIRLWGAPAILATLTAFGTLRGLQDMRTPLWIALGVNALNIVLDAPLIFGLGPIPALGVAGAALASVVSQWVGALWVLHAVYTRLGRPHRLYARDAGNLLRVGGDLFIRTGLLTVFLLLTTRTATRIGADAGAAHQAIRQVWTFAALFLDAFAITGQSLVAYFVGARQKQQARHVALLVCAWSVGIGVILGLTMWLGEDLVARLLVPPDARALFGPAWLITAASQPINALSFGTDGIHWGTGDFRYLRNAVFVATLCGGGALSLLGATRPDAFLWVWIITAGWICIRAAFGVIRIWPGLWHAPLALDEEG
jgi:MATE family multidrug resistance protein